MCKRSPFRTPFGSQRVNESQSRLKSVRHNFYTILPLLWDKLSCKKLFLVRFEILALFLNTMASNDKISRRNRDNFKQQIQRQLSENPKAFSQFFFAFLKFPSNFGHFEKKEESRSLSISEIIDSQKDGYLKF